MRIENKKIKELRTGEAQLFYSRLVSDFASGEETRRRAAKQPKQNRERKKKMFWMACYLSDD